MANFLHNDSSRWQNVYKDDFFSFIFLIAKWMIATLAVHHKIEKINKYSNIKKTLLVTMVTI